MSSEVRSLKIQITGFESMSLKFHVNYNGSQFISSQAPFILALTETWISPEDMISLVFLKGYSVFLSCIPGATSLEWRWVIFLYLSHFYSIFLLLPQKQSISKLLIPPAYSISLYHLSPFWLQNPESRTQNHTLHFVTILAPSHCDIPTSQLTILSDVSQYSFS